MSDSDQPSYSMLNLKTQTQSDLDYAQGINDYFPASLGTPREKLQNFTKFVSRQTLSHFLAKHAIFQRVLPCHGCFVECGVFLGGGLMTWAQLSAIYEPYNHTRRIFGFDTFTGFPSLHEKDKPQSIDYVEEGGLAANAEEDIRAGLRLFDQNRPIGHIPRVELVVGDAIATIPQFLESNPHLVVAMLYLDFDLYEPTKVALETFLPRMPKGAVIVFDELNQAEWPGETLAVLDAVGLRQLRIERFPFTPQISYAVL